jgi:hypothetical protein
MAKTGFRWSAALIVVTLVAVLQSCGGSSSSTTKADFVKDANAVCTKGEQQRSEVFSRLSQEYAGKEVTQTNREEAILELIKPYEQQTEQLAELAPPQGEEKRIEAMVSAMEEGASRAQADPGIVLNGGAPFGKADSLAVAYGLKHCKF